MKYRKKPVVIEAMQFTNETKDQVLNFIACSAHPSWDDAGNPSLKIQTLEGWHTATLGDFIIKGIAGEFYPCKPDIFEATHEKVKE